jgi:hypothetical protein
VADARTPGLVSAAVMADSQRVMTDKVGVLRTASGMTEAVDDLAALANKAEDDPRTESWAVTNLVTISSALGVGRVAARGDAWLALARGLPGARRRALARAHRHGAGRRRAAPVVPPRRRAGRRLMDIARTPYDALPSSVLDELEAAGVPPRPVYDAIVLALEEDLPGGATDVTSDATDPRRRTRRRRLRGARARHPWRVSASRSWCSTT